ncbi:hypothetical protein [Allorhizocola rhizosphaerae]|uniref:hypothetical protein n=1 Tax=Allorhizocola rhizosphaerae TaxID=1872709 RepID=UPI0013C2FD90|nr:hypothetical protein [Allorhizocola rhizosphaerae]
MAKLDDFEWIEELFPEGIGVDLGSDGDEWRGHVFAHLADVAESSGYQMHSQEGGGYLYTPSGGRMTTSLLITRSTNNRPICHVLGRGERNDADVATWVDAIDHAVRQLGEKKSYPWWAVIGEDPDARISPPIRMVDERTVGGIRLLPARTAFIEPRAGRSIASSTTARTFLVHAHGVSTGYAAHVAMREAARNLRILCSLLSLISGRTWVLRSGPSYVTRVADGQPITEAPTLPEYTYFLPEEMRREENSPEPIPLSFPASIEAAWGKLLTERRIADLIVAFHESLLLDSGGHDSYALLGCVAVIEAIGNRGYKKLPRCKGCDNCNGCRNVIGAAARFRDALARVMNADRAKELGNLVYGRRSDTAHEGVLHGIEPEFGAGFRFGELADDPPIEFGYTVRRLRYATVQLLRNELGLPDRLEGPADADAKGVIGIASTAGGRMP